MAVKNNAAPIKNSAWERRLLDVAQEKKEWQRQLGISDSLLEKLLCPPEHKLRERPAQLWSHVISLPDAIESCGKAMFQTEWQGTPENPFEWYARNPVTIKIWNDPQRDNYRHLSHMAMDTEELWLCAGVEFSGADIEAAAYRRKEAVFQKLIAWLNLGKADAFTIEGNGNRQTIPAHEWLQSKAFNVLEYGRRSGEKRTPHDPTHDLDAVHLDYSQFSELLREFGSEQINVSPSTNRGPPERYNWAEFHAELTRIIHDEGVPERQSILESRMAEWCRNTWGQEPSESMIRSKISPTYSALTQNFN